MNVKNSYYWRTLKNEMWCNQSDTEVYNVFLCTTECEAINLMIYNDRVDYESILQKCIDNLKSWAEEAKNFDKTILYGRFIEAAKDAEYSKKFVDNQLKMMGIA